MEGFTFHTYSENKWESLQFSEYRTIEWTYRPWISTRTTGRAGNPELVFLKCLVGISSSEQQSWLRPGALEALRAPFMLISKGSNLIFICREIPFLSHKTWRPCSFQCISEPRNSLAPCICIPIPAGVSEPCFSLRLMIELVALCPFLAPHPTLSSAKL